MVGGTTRISERLAEDLGDAVVLGDPGAASPRRRRGDRESDAGSYRADRVIVAVPPTLAGRIDYEPALPARRDLLTQRSPTATSSRSWSATTVRSGATTA